MDSWVHPITVFLLRSVRAGTSSSQTLLSGTALIDNFILRPFCMMAAVGKGVEQEFIHPV